MKKFICLILAIVLILCLAGCGFRGYDWIDTNYHFNRAIIAMPDGTTVEVEIEKWADSEDGEQITITSTDGIIYMTNSTNIVMIKDD